MLHSSLRLVGYARCNGGLSTLPAQIAQIKAFCQHHKHSLVEIFTDNDHPGLGLHMAIERLDTADGLIVTNCKLLIDHDDDTLRELRPLVETRFMHGHKKLLSLDDGIETVTAAGQHNLMNLFNEWTLKEDEPKPTIDKDMHDLYTANF